MTPTERPNILVILADQHRFDYLPDDFPWYYFCSFVGPHDPFDPPAEYAERYRAADVPEAVHDQLEGKPGWVKRRQINATPKDIAVSRRQYCGAIELIDLNPTLCELAGLPHQENIDARSFVSVLRGKQRDHRPETVSAIRNWRCIRDRRFKLIQNDNDITELYDLEQDPHELENIASQSPALVRDLTAGLRARFLEAKWLR